MTVSRNSAVFLVALGAIAISCSTPTYSAPGTDLCAENHDSVAVVIGNKDYQQAAPDVPYALNDARAIKQFLVDGFCYREGNIILLENATYVDFVKTFGDANSPEGKLWNWARAGQSNVFVYYSGHGAPDIRTGDGFLVPVDGDPNDSRFGLSLKTLVTNLQVLKRQRLGKTREVTLVLDACFSGREGTGKPLIRGSFSGWTPKRPETGNDILQFSAAAADEIARWDDEREHGLFTRVFLDAASGKADRGRTGNNDGTVSAEELTRYIDNEVTYLARRRFGDDQTPELPSADRISWRLAVSAVLPPSKPQQTSVPRPDAPKKTNLPPPDLPPDSPFGPFYRDFFEEDHAPKVAPKTSQRVLGMTLSSITPEYRKRFNIAEDISGVVITDVDPDSHAAERKLKAGDVIQEIHQQDVSTSADAAATVEALKKKGRRSVLLLTINADGYRFVAIRLPRG